MGSLRIPLLDRILDHFHQRATPAGAERRHFFRLDGDLARRPELYYRVLVILDRRRYPKTGAIAFISVSVRPYFVVLDLERALHSDKTLTRCVPFLPSFASRCSATVSSSLKQNEESSAMPDSAVAARVGGFPAGGAPRFCAGAAPAVATRRPFETALARVSGPVE